MAKSARECTGDARRRVRQHAWKLADKAYQQWRDAMLADLAEGYPVGAIEEWQPPAASGERPERDSGGGT
jgi:hypothetical protein